MFWHHLNLDFDSNRYLKDAEKVMQSVNEKGANDKFTPSILKAINGYGIAQELQNLK